MLVASVAPRPLEVLLVEDDDGDALLVEEYLLDFDEPVNLRRATTIAAAIEQLAGVDCVLLDLGLPDAVGLEGLQELDRRGSAAIVVLTGDSDTRRGRGAVGAGAQDYLVKSQIDGRLLGRTLQYAVERQRAELVTRQLHEARLQERENQRLERGLLPSALLGEDPSLTVSTRYEPGHQQLVLGGDFYDAVRTGDGWVHVIVGDVCGHGPDEAALGVCLRIAWRTLVLAGVPAAQVLPVLQQVLVSERSSPVLFATACMVSVAPERDRVSVYLAGHPAPVLVADGSVELVDESRRGVPLGVLAVASWEAVEVVVRPGWAVLVYTDGLVEGRDSDGEQLWSEGLVALLARQLEAEQRWRDDSASLLAVVIDAVKADRPHRTDDLAALLLVHTVDAERR
ncbi:PP2C family protein-serine/threonine phosphatase [Pseudonocardia humida]|uniref:SpoIIE family protein phosphatase n=1 Tax=Pseudonocardia humida TaxID=2800819 RepID=A0ABT1A7H5_9PSEU|nr:SpoIIE family protein phosphatase [Pseudonocardia humida]MCO1658980.1 SpoIIE family protein phosphatase [Pseudonocardia humida]